MDDHHTLKAFKDVSHCASFLMGLATAGGGDRCCVDEGEECCPRQTLKIKLITESYWIQRKFGHLEQTKPEARIGETRDSRSKQRDK